MLIIPSLKKSLIVEQYQGNYINNLKVSRIADHYAYFYVLVIYFLYRTGTIRHKMKIHKQYTANLCSLSS